jgi:hypothetical protein
MVQGKSFGRGNIMHVLMYVMLMTLCDHHILILNANFADIFG